MRKAFNIVSLIFVLLMANSFGYADNNYDLHLTQSGTHKVYKDINPYLFVHYTYSAIFVLNDLINKYDLNTKRDIIKSIYHSLSEEEPTSLVLHDNEDLAITFCYFKSTKEDVLTFSSDVGFMSFSVINKKMIYNSSVSWEDREEEAKSNLNNLADFYIFDAKDENDHLVEALLNKSINESNDPSTKCGSLLTLSQYYLLVQDFNKAKETLNKAKILLTGEITGNDHSLHNIYQASEEEYEITYALANEQN